jgi:hypothetical protein
LLGFFDKNTYFQVTATPQALFLQTPGHDFRPKFTARTSLSSFSIQTVRTPLEARAISRSCGHFEGSSAKGQHARALARINAEAIKNKKPLELKPFEPYCLRHTALTRLGDSGCDAFTLARIAGHSSITITQRYVHPQADAIERAFSKLGSGQLRAAASAGGHKNGHKEKERLLKSGKKSAAST